MYIKQKSVVLNILLGISLISGCSHNNANEPVLLPDYSQSQKPSMPEGDAIQEEDVNELTLANALVLTLQKNPDLKAFSYELRAAEAKIIQANLIPNPEISITVEDVGGTGGYKGIGQSQSTLQLSQVIELGGKRSARVEVAAAMHERMKDSYEIKRVEILSSLADKFLRVVADEQLLELAKKAKILASNALSNVKKRSSAGGASELEEAKSRVYLARANIAHEHAEHEFETSKHELASYWGSDSPKFKKIVADIFATKNIPMFESLMNKVKQSLEIKRWVNEKRLREAEQKLAQAKSIPNLTFGAGPRRLETSGENSWVFQISMPLAVFDRNQGSRLETQTLLDKVIIDEEAGKLRLKTVLFGLYQEMKHAKTEMEMMKSVIIPQAERSLRIAEEANRQGRLSYLELIDTQRTLLEVYRENIEASYSFHQFINSIERLLGSSLTDEKISL